MHLIAIDRIERTRIAEQKVCFDRPYYRWEIHSNWPAGGRIAFCATGFTQTLRAAAVATTAQCLTLGLRQRLATLT
jgi:hypothetical protein